MKEVLDSEKEVPEDLSGQRKKFLLRFFKDPWKCDPCLTLVFSLSVFIGCFALIIALQEEYLCDTFIGIDLRWKRCSVRDLNGNMPLKTRFKRRNIHDDTTSCIGTFP